MESMAIIGIVITCKFTMAVYYRHYVTTTGESCCTLYCTVHRQGCSQEIWFGGVDVGKICRCVQGTRKKIFLDMPSAH